MPSPDPTGSGPDSRPAPFLGGAGGHKNWYTDPDRFVPRGPDHGRRADDRRHPALPGRSARGWGRRAGRPGAAGAGGRPPPAAVRFSPLPELPAADATPREPGDGRAPRGRGGRALDGPAGDL